MPSGPEKPALTTELHVRYVGDDDPEKCTARKLARFDLAELHRSPGEVPPGVVLNPFARALAGALVVLGERERASELLGKFTWGETFLELNAEPLERYAACADSAAVVAVQAEYLADE